MNELQAFFAMGGYGGYVWSAYAISAVVLLFNVYMSKREVEVLMQKARRMQRAAATKNRDQA